MHKDRYITNISIYNHNITHKYVGVVNMIINDDNNDNDNND